MTTNSITNDGANGSGLKSTLGKFDRTLDWSFRIWIRSSDTIAVMCGIGELFGTGNPNIHNFFGNQVFSANGTDTTIPGSAFSASVWTFLAAAHDATNGQTTIYRMDEGGSMQSTGPFTDNSYVAGTGYDSIVMTCGEGIAGEEMAGDVAGYAIWTAFLSSGEITAEAAYMKPSRTANLNRFYLCDSAATAGNDTSGNAYNGTSVSGFTDGPAGPNIPLEPVVPTPPSLGPTSITIFFGAGTTS